MEKRVIIAILIGLFVNIVSIYIGNPYLISLLIIPIATWITLQWKNDPLPWIALVSVIAANPVNINASISLNLIFAGIFIALNFNSIEKLPSWLIIVLILMLISVAGSIVDWHKTTDYFTQFASVINYILGPFLLVPLTYSRLKNVVHEKNAEQVLRIFIFALIIPSIVFMFVAWYFGKPVIDFNVNSKYQINVSVFHLGDTLFQLTRTQSGILLAALLCASFAVAICNVAKITRIVAVGAIFVVLLLLLVTGSVGSSLSALCGLVIMLVIASRYVPWRKYAIVLVVLLGLGTVLWSQLPQDIKNYAESRYTEKVAGGINISDRSGRWLSSLHFLIENPLGRGWSLYVETIGTYPHNDYISYSIAFGILCGGFYLFIPALILLLMIIGIRRSNNSAELAVYLAGIGAVTVLLVNSFSDHLTANRWYFNVTWAIIWFCYFACSSTTNSSSSPKLEERSL